MSNNTNIKLSENETGASIKINVTHDTDALYGGYLLNVEQVQENTNEDQSAPTETVLGGIKVTSGNIQQLMTAMREAQAKIIADEYRHDCIRVDINKAVVDEQTASSKWTEVFGAYDSSYIRLRDHANYLTCMARITPDGYVNTTIKNRGEDYRHTVRCLLDTAEINNAINECYAHAINHLGAISAA